jgi:hypothetical protein
VVGVVGVFDISERVEVIIFQIVLEDWQRLHSDIRDLGQANSRKYRPGLGNLGKTLRGSDRKGTRAANQRPLVNPRLAEILFKSEGRMAFGAING